MQKRQLFGRALAMMFLTMFFSLTIFFSFPASAEEKQTLTEEKQNLTEEKQTATNEKQASAEEKHNQRFFGVGVFGGGKTEKWSPNSFWNNYHRYTWQYFALQPMYGWRMDRISDRWRIWVEADLGYIHFNRRQRDESDISTFELRLMTSYDFLRFEKVNLFVVKLKDVNFFAELGGGIGYWNGTPDKKLIGHNPLGSFAYGLGFRFSLGNDYYLEADFRFKHTSSIPWKDKGLNTDAGCAKIIKYF